MMKFTSRVLSLIAAGGIIATATVADASMSIRGNTKSANKLMTFSRRLEDQQNYGNNNQYNGGYNGQYGNNNQNQDANNYQGGYDNNYNNNGGGNNNNGGQNQNQNYQNNGGNNGGGYGGGYGDGDADEESMYFLNNYSIKLLSCIQGEQIINYENGEAEPSTVVFRLCPSNTCDMNSAMGCDSGYGDYAVGINTFLEAYMESQEDNDQDQYGGNSMLAYNSYGQEFDASEYMECAEYDAEENADQDQNYYQYNNNNGQNQNQQYNNYNGAYGNNNNAQGGNYNNYNNNNGQRQRQRRQQNNNYNYYQNVQLYIGPGCSDDGTTIGLNMFMDDTCSYATDFNFADVAYGWDSLPFSNGGLVSMNCMACYGPDEDYNYELSEMCTETYSASTSRCEANMSSYSYYGQANSGCDYVESLVQAVYGSGNDEDDEDGASATTSLATSFMETLSTREARAFIACMIIFCLSAVGGSALFGYFFHNKRKRAQASREGKLLDDGDYEPPIALTDEDGNPIVKRRSSVVALVKDGVYYVKEGLKVGVENAKVGVAKATNKTEKALQPCSYDVDETYE